MKFGVQWVVGKMQVRTTSEDRRITALRELGILDHPAEPHLEAVCRTAAALFNVPMALVTLVDGDTVWVKASWGLPAGGGVPRDQAFCSDTIRVDEGQANVIPDLLEDDRYAASVLVVGDPHARFYAGVPLALRTGLNIGAVCLMDTVPRPDFGPERIPELQDLALIVEAHLRLHETRLSRDKVIGERQRVETLLVERERAHRQTDTLHDMAEAVAGFGQWSIDFDDARVCWSSGIARIFDRPLPPNGKIDLSEHLSFYHPEDRSAVLRRIEDALRGRYIDKSGEYQKRARIVRPSGEVRDVIINGYAQRDQKGNVIALYGVILDVTDLAKSEQEAHATSELLRTTLENMDQGLLMLGPDQRVRIHNRRVRDLLDLPESILFDGAAFDPIRQFLSERGEYADADARSRDWAQHGGLETEPTCYERQRADGIALEIRATPLPDGGVVRTFTDVTLRKAVERSVAESEQRYRLLAENTTDIIIWADLDTTRRYVSPAAKSVLGYDPDELVGTKPLDFVHPDDAITYGAILFDLCQNNIDSVVTTQRYRRKDGSFVWLEASFSLTRDQSDGPFTGYVASLRDVSDRKHVEENLRISEERLSMALDSGDDGIWDWNVESGAIVYTGLWHTKMGFGVDDQQFVIENWAALVHPDDMQAACEALVAHLKGLTSSYHIECRIRSNITNQYRWTLTRGKVVERNAKGRAIRVVGTHIDITRRKEAELLVAHLAVHDALTGLPNRTLFQDRLDQEIRHVERYGGAFAVLSCDLDRFKLVNDTLGHNAGDVMLREVSNRLLSTTRECDTVARLGGDEFAIILGRLENSHDARLAAQRVLSLAEEPIYIDGKAVSMNLSIGIAVGPADGSDVEQIYKNADIALYRAKASGRNTCRFFEAGMDALIAKRKILEQDMQDAVRRNEFVLHYQPIIDLASGAVESFEALLRWQHPSRGMISPTEFIPIAEESGLIVSIGEWALREACREAAAWPSAVRVAVNVSAVQFQKPGLEQSVVSALSTSGLAADKLELEITESVLVQDAEAVISCLERLRGLGVRIGLDDFGTGYSSLSYLHRFPFNKIKIDRSFIQEIDAPVTASIVRAVITIGLQLGATITAEGVETDEQLKRVREEGCTEVQGFFFSKPLAAEDARKYLASRARARAA